MVIYTKVYFSGIFQRPARKELFCGKVYADNEFRLKLRILKLFRDCGKQLRYLITAESLSLFAHIPEHSAQSIGAAYSVSVGRFVHKHEVIIVLSEDLSDLFKRYLLHCYRPLRYSQAEYQAP